MTLPSSGPIHTARINNEFGRASNAAFSFDGALERGLAGKPSGKITLRDFYGKTRREPFSGDYYNTGTLWRVHTFGGSVSVYWGGKQIPAPLGGAQHNLTSVVHNGWRYHRSGLKQTVSNEHHYGIYRVRL